MWHFCVRKEGNSVSERRAPTRYPNVGPTHCGDTNFMAQIFDNRDVMCNDEVSKASSVALGGM